MRFGKLSRTSARTAGEARGDTGKSLVFEDMQLFASDILNGGMNTTIHSHKLPDNTLTLAQGFEIDYDGLLRRSGHDILTPAKPDSNYILGFYAFKRFDGTVKLYRFTKNSINSYASGAWTAITGAALAGGDSDRFTVISFLDRLFFNNNGIDNLQEINLTANTYGPAGNAPKYKYYATGNNRIVGANLLGVSPNPIQVGWSGDLNPTEWDNTIDFSAGNQSILEASGGTGDDITGIFNVDNVFLLTREKSIWVGEFSAVATLPFLWRQAVPDIGASVPYAISRVSGGVAWFDSRLRNVFLYQTGNSSLANSDNAVTGSPGLLRIGDAIKKELKNIDPSKVFSAFNKDTNTYILGILSAVSSKVALWKFNLDVGQWVYDEMTNITGFWYPDFSGSSITIGDLVGTIGDIVGTIGDMGAIQSQITEFVGKQDGDILKKDEALVQEGGSNFTCLLESKDYKLPAINESIAQLKLRYIPIIGGTFTVSYSIDGGLTYIVYEIITYSSGNEKVQKIAVFSKNITCSQFKWKVELNNGRLKIVEYEIHVYPGGDTRSSS